MTFSNELLRLIRAKQGAELVEFAVCLPLLVVLVVGVYDFGTAFTLKHKLNSAAEEGAKVGSRLVMPATWPNTNGGCGAPASICAVRDVVDSTLVASNVNDCGLATSGAVPGPSLTWTFTANCPAPMSLKIERGVVIPNAIVLSPPFSSTPYTTEATRVTLTYPYSWQFNRVIRILSPSSNYLGSTITAQTTMLNIN